jgi:hypothetical protein
MNDVNISYETRLSIIAEINPNYAIKIMDFMENHPEFLEIGRMIPLTELPYGYNRNYGEVFDNSRPDCVLEHLVHYIAESGVNSSYAAKQWKEISNYMRNGKDIRKNNVLENLNSFASEKSFKIQPKKVAIYENLNNLLKEYKIFPNYSLTYDQFIKIFHRLKGVGNGCFNHMTMIWGTENDRKNITPDFTDIGFVKGFQKFYKLDNKPTKKQMLDIASKWSDKEIGNAMMTQCFHYL